jgi:Rrf2 family protein
VRRPFLRKILQVLNRKGMLRSIQGSGGGFMLVKPPSRIFLTDIMRIFQGELSLNECLLNKLICPRKSTCVLRKRIVKIEDYVIKELSSISIASLLR